MVHVTPADRRRHRLATATCVSTTRTLPPVATHLGPFEQARLGATHSPPPDPTPRKPPPDQPSTAAQYLQPINKRPLLTMESLAQHRLGKCSLAVSADHITRGLLFRAVGGVPIAV